MIVLIKLQTYLHVPKLPCIDGMEFGHVHGSCFKSGHSCFHYLNKVLIHLCNPIFIVKLSCWGLWVLS